MNQIKYLFLAGAIVMGVSIIYGFTNGDFWGDGSTLITLLWGRITLIDIYLSFLTFSGWMFFREGLTFKSILIFFFILLLGAFTICFYTYVAMQKANGDWKLFWFGSRRAISSQQKISL